MTRLLRSAYVIGRRDFTATVLSKSFILFLLAPLFPVLLTLAFGGIGARVANDAERPVVAVIGSQAEVAQLSAARNRLADALGGGGFIELAGFPPQSDLQAQQRDLLAGTSVRVLAVLSGGLDHPHLKGSVSPDGATVH
ncbi:MAG: ABC transporter permease, partial [Sphingomicrobium sp.]